VNRAVASEYGEIVRLGALSLLVALLGLLLQSAHAYLHSNFLNNALILHALDPVLLGDVCCEALITFLAFVIFRRFLTCRWQTWAVALCFVALWAFVGTLAEAHTK